MPDTIEHLSQRLADSRERLHRKKRHERVLAQARSQLAEARKALERSEARSAAEQEDVDRLEHVSFGALWATIIGRREQRLDAERAEAAAARSLAQQDRERVRWLLEDVERIASEGADLADAEDRYRGALADKEQAMLALGLPASSELDAIAERVSELRAERSELGEAIEAGQRALERVDDVGDLLESANKTSTWDLFGGGELVSQFKYDKLDSAGEAAARAQRALDEFSRELSDVGVQQRHRTPEIPNNWVTDVLFDNFVTDAVRNGQIRDITEDFDGIRSSVRKTLGSLRDRDAEAEAELERLRTRREALLVEDG